MGTIFAIRASLSISKLERHTNMIWTCYTLKIIILQDQHFEVDSSGNRDAELACSRTRKAGAKLFFLCEVNDFFEGTPLEHSKRQTLQSRSFNRVVLVRTSSYAPLYLA